MPDSKDVPIHEKKAATDSQSSQAGKQSARSAFDPRWMAPLIALPLLIGLLGVWSMVFLTRWVDRPQGQPAVHEFTIAAGTPARAIALDLSERGLIDHPKVFLIWLKSNDQVANLQAGEYRIETPITPRNLIEKLGRGSFERSLTIPEGWTSRQIARRLVAEEWIDDERIWMDLVERPLDGSIVGEAQPSAEGFLFPDTYRLEENSNAEAILGRMLREFRRQWEAARPEDRSPAATALNLREVVILASMIEREARDPEEMPLIASVYHNRLRRNMKLQCCATVHYALGHVWDRPLTYDDLKIDSPYNTYLHPGLPPGPIANPGREALEAVLRPADSDYLFYVYAGDGRHLFSKTFREHQKAVREARRTNPQAAVTQQQAD